MRVETIPAGVGEHEITGPIYGLRFLAANAVSSYRVNGEKVASPVAALRSIPAPRGKPFDRVDVSAGGSLPVLVEVVESEEEAALLFSPIAPLADAEGNIKAAMFAYDPGTGAHKTPGLLSGAYDDANGTFVDALAAFIYGRTAAGGRRAVAVDADGAVAGAIYSNDGASYYRRRGTANGAAGIAGMEALSGEWMDLVCDAAGRIEPSTPAAANEIASGQIQAADPAGEVWVDVSRFKNGIGAWVSSDAQAAVPVDPLRVRGANSNQGRIIDGSAGLLGVSFIAGIPGQLVQDSYLFGAEWHEGDAELFKRPAFPWVRVDLPAGNGGGGQAGPVYWGVWAW